MIDAASGRRSPEARRPCGILRAHGARRAARPAPRAPRRAGDLGGTTTGSVGLGEGGTVASRELAGDQLRLRAAGMDWPLHGLTMVGLNRLDDLQACVESVVDD